MTFLIVKLRGPAILFNLFSYRVYLWIFKSCPVSDVIRTKCEIKFEKRYGFISRQIYWGLFRYVTCSFCNLILDKLTAITRKSILKKCVRCGNNEYKHSKIRKYFGYLLYHYFIWIFEQLEIISNYCFIVTNILVISHSNAKIFYVPAGVLLLILFYILKSEFLWVI